MADYLQPISKKLRVLSALGLTLVAVLLILLFVMLLVAGIRHDRFAEDDYGLVLLLAFIGLTGLIFSYLAWRLWRGATSANAVTLIPTWFIQVFGVFLLAGAVFGAYHGTNLFLLEGVFVALAMIFIGRHIARKKRDGK